MQIQIIKPKPNVQMSFMFWEPVGLRSIHIAILVVDTKIKQPMVSLNGCYQDTLLIALLILAFVVGI